MLLKETLGFGLGQYILILDLTRLHTEISIFKQKIKQHN